MDPQLQITLAIIGGCVAILTVVLPIILPVMLNRSHKKTREFSDERSKHTNERIERVEASVESLCKKVDNNTTTVQGLHLLDVIEHRPHCWETIRQMFSAYSSVGGNGHVERVYRQWEDDYGKFYNLGEVPPILMKDKENADKFE